MLQQPQQFDLTEPESLPQEPIQVACTLRRPNHSRTWERSLAVAGELDLRSQGLRSPYADVQGPWKSGAEPQCYLVNFRRFRSSQRVEAYAKANGFVPAHPRALSALAEAQPDLPERLKVGTPFSITSLVPCYREDNELFVMSVSWSAAADRRFERKVRGVYYRYGWEPQYWFVFEDRPHAANH